MKRWVLLLLWSFTYVTYAFQWADLWLTKDQQAQLLLNQGQFKQAETLFQKSDWRATAAYRSGNYQSASQLYHSLGNELGYYNEGNALAHLGQFKQAIKAYDNALTLNPHNKDALHNRKLVEELLKKNQNNSENKQNQQNENQQNKDQPKQNQQNENQQNKDQQKQNQQNENQQNKDQQKQNQQGENQQNKEQNKEQKKQNQQGGNQQNKEQQKQNQQGENQRNKVEQNQQEKPEQSDKTEQADTAKGQIADYEKQQAKNQWLRLIPDDPGGLMREKFLRDHLRREGEDYP